MNKTFEQDGAIIYYEDTPEGVAIVGYEGKQSQLCLPDRIDGKEVTLIGKKAFFNVPGLSRVYIPKTVCTIDDWAFSHCRDLERIYLPKKSYELGKDIFLECNKLQEISVEDSQRDFKDFGKLLAATCGVLDAPYLFQTEIDDMDEWLSLWDARMFSILEEDDMEGYTTVLLCGEEDYGSKENNLDFFLSEKRKRKVRLAFLRLLYHNGLKESHKKALQQFLLNHTMGCEHTQTWQVLKEEHPEDVAYISLFLDIGCVTQDNFDAILEDTDSKYPQLKTYLMRYKEEKLSETDFFDGLNLDF